MSGPFTRCTSLRTAGIPHGSSIQEWNPMVLGWLSVEYKNMPEQDLKNVHNNVHSSTQTVRNCLGTIQSVGTLFRNYTKNNNILKKSIRELLPASRHTTLLSMCKTLWVHKHEAILRFKVISVGIVHALQ